MWTNEYIDENFNIGDGVTAVVTEECKSGIFLRLENGQEAFAKFGGLCPGVEVLCTVLKKATKTFRVLVAIDSIFTQSLG